MPPSVDSSLPSPSAGGGPSGLTRGLLIQAAVFLPLFIAWLVVREGIAAGVQVRGPFPDHALWPVVWTPAWILLGIAIAYERTDAGMWIGSFLASVAMAVSVGVGLAAQVTTDAARLSGGFAVAAGVALLITLAVGAVQRRWGRLLLLAPLAVAGWFAMYAFARLSG